MLRYYDHIMRDGIAVRVRKAKKLARVSEQYPNKRSVLLLAEKILQPLNSGQLQPESSQSVVSFIEKSYMPAMAQSLRPSTLKGYRRPRPPIGSRPATSIRRGARRRVRQSGQECAAFPGSPR
jgi:hypothetical protein